MIRRTPKLGSIVSNYLPPHVQYLGILDEPKVFADINLTPNDILITGFPIGATRWTSAYRKKKEKLMTSR